RHVPIRYRGRLPVESGRRRQPRHGRLEAHRLRPRAHAHAALRLLRRRVRRGAGRSAQEGKAAHGSQAMREAMRKFSPGEEVDFVIVGSGAAGGVLARELSLAGFRVVVLEQGPYRHQEEFKHNEFKTIFQNELIIDWKRQPTTFRKTEQEKANVQPALMYGRLVGGGSVHFTANFWRFHEIDFIERSKRGPVTGADLADWPITYADLEPYYTKVEWEVGVSGQAGVSPFDPPRSKPYPMPPLPIKSTGALLERTGRCEIRPESYAHEIRTDAAGRATGVAYFDSKKRENFQKAKAVIVSANGAETPRLLLLSKSSLFPEGLANSSGLVGRHLMFNSFALANAQFEHALNEYKSQVVTRVVHDFYELDPKVGFCGGGGMDMRFDQMPISFALGGTPPGVPQWGAEYKAHIQQNFTRTACVFCHATSLPVPTNSISLDPDVKDEWGLPVLRVTYKDHPDDLKTCGYLLERAMELLDVMPTRRKWKSDVREQEFGVHLLGTCRMGNDPKTSVINSDHRTHDV